MLTRLDFAQTKSAVRQYSYELEYVKEETYWDLRKKAEEISRMLTSLRASQLNES